MGSDPGEIVVHARGEPELHNRYSNWLRAGQSRGRSSSPDTAKKFPFSTSSRPALGPTHPPYWGSFPGSKALGA
jgi:hypothetical protein